MKIKFRTQGHLQWSLLSKRLDHHQDHDTDHQYGRYLIDYSVEFLIVLILIEIEFAYPSDKKSMDRRHGQHQNYFGVEPARHVKPPIKGEPETQNPTCHHGGIDDDPQKPLLHHLESLRLLGTGLGSAMIDKQARQVEHTGHPGNDRDDVQGLEPRIEARRLQPDQNGQPHRNGDKPRDGSYSGSCSGTHGAAPYPLTRCRTRSTWSIGVSGTVP